MKNPFRMAFAALPPIDDVDGTQKSAVPLRLDLLTRALFIDAKCLDVTSLAAAILPSKCGAPINSNFYVLYRKLVDEGRILTSWSGRGTGAGRTPHAFDLRFAAPFMRRTDFGSLLEGYLASTVSGAAAKSSLAASRVLLGLPTHSSRASVIRVGRFIPCEAFHGLPQRFSAEHVSKGTLKKKTIQNFASALRAILTFGVVNDLFPLFFPELRTIDAWSEEIDRAFPLAAVSKSAKTVSTARSGLKALFEVAQLELGLKEPGALTPEVITECYRRLGAPHRRQAKRRVDALLKSSGKTTGDWNNPIVHVVVTTLLAMRRQTPIPFLEAPAHVHLPSVGTVDGFCNLVEAHGLCSEWRTSFEWYRDYSTMDFRWLLARGNEFPARPSARKLRPSSFDNRIVAARAYLGVAQILLPDEFSRLEPDDVFGTHFSLLTSEMLRLWEESSELSNGVSHASSAGLHHIICGGGLVAQALLERSLHARRPYLLLTASKKKDGTIDSSEERLASDRTPLERILNDSYKLSRAICDGLRVERRRSDVGSGNNTVKDLKRSIAETPFSRFKAAQKELLRRVQELRTAHLEKTRRGRALIVATLVHGLLVSSGCRRSELAHLREGKQVMLGTSSRFVNLRACDRKNEKTHTYCIRADWLPEWFLELYLRTIRPAIAAKRKDVEGHYPFLILNPFTGRPYGCEEEQLTDGKGRNDRAFANRKSQLNELWSQHVAEAFVALGYDVPVGPQRFCIHIVRNVSGHWVFVNEGLEEAAHFLGDTPTAVLGTYAELEGWRVDTARPDREPKRTYSRLD